MAIFSKIFGKKEDTPETIPIRTMVNPPQPGLMPPAPPMGAPPATMQAMARQPVQPMARPMLPAPVPPAPAPPQGAIQPMRMPPAPVLPMAQQMIHPPVRPEEQVESQQVFTSGTEQAPVFIKIDRYEDILGELSTIKSTVENIRTLMEIFTIMRDVQADSVGVLDSLAKEVERSQIKLDKILGRMEPVHERVKGSRYDRVRKRQPKELSEIENRIGKLREEIKRLGRV